MRGRAAGNRAFTLAEVLVATTISAFIAVVAVGALKAVTDSSQVVNRASETAAEVRFAAQMITRDLANLYRDPDRKSMKLVCSSEESSLGGPTILTFYMAGRAKARPDQPEGDVYEVEYFLGQNLDDTSSPETAGSILFRRLWPNPDEERPPGGILTPIAEEIDLFAVRFFDGTQWAGEWPEEMASLPQLMEVTLAAQPDRGEPVIETFMVNFPRLVANAGPMPDMDQLESGGAPQEEQGSEALPEAAE
jgi:type II secretion system protein J